MVTQHLGLCLAHGKQHAMSAISRICVCVCSTVCGRVWDKSEESKEVLEGEGSMREKRGTRILPQMLALDN